MLSYSDLWCHQSTCFAGCNLLSSLNNSLSMNRIVETLLVFPRLICRLSQLGVELPAFSGHPFKQLLYILRSLYDNLCGGRCEQWQNNGGQWGFVALGSQRPTDWILFKRVWGGWPGRAATGRRWCRLYVAIKISIFRRNFLPFRRENPACSSRSLTGGSGCEEDDRLSRWSWRDLLSEVTDSIVSSCQSNLTQ